jgi:hypothetical protein
VCVCLGRSDRGKAGDWGLTLCSGFVCNRSLHKTNHTEARNRGKALGDMNGDTDKD